MAHSFNTTSGRKTFGTFKPSLYASDYITNKKAKAVFCDSSVCPKGISESNLLLLKKSNYLKVYSCNDVNTANLNINLITKLNLNDVTVITPTTMDSTETNPYLVYTIDPSGSLFGNTICGENNYINYQEYNAAYTTSNPGYIDNL